MYQKVIAGMYLIWAGLVYLSSQQHAPELERLSSGQYMFTVVVALGIGFVVIRTFMFIFIRPFLSTGESK